MLEGQRFYFNEVGVKDLAALIYLGVEGIWFHGLQVLFVAIVLGNVGFPSDEKWLCLADFLQVGLVDEGFVFHGRVFNRRNQFGLKAQIYNYRYD